MSITKSFTAFANAVSRVTGRAWTFVICCVVVGVWALSGPAFGFSDTWQLVINTGTTIVTFLMVFLIQNTQNRDNAALQAKLDELIRISAAENRFIGIEKLTDRELEGILDEVENNAEDILEGRPAKDGGIPVSPPKKARKAPTRASVRKAHTKGAAR